MLKINLLPPDLKKKKLPKLKWQFAGKVTKLPLLPSIACAVAFLMILQVSVMGILGYKKKALTSYKARWEKVAPNMKEVTILKNELNEMEGTKRAIDNLTKGRFLWAKFLKSLSDSMTPGVWLTRLKVSKISEQPARMQARGRSAETTEEVLMSVTRALILNGSVTARKGEETAHVGRFVDSLKKNADFFTPFSDIKLDSIERRGMGGVEVMDFELICQFKE